MNRIPALVISSLALATAACQARQEATAPPPVEAPAVETAPADVVAEAAAVDMASEAPAAKASYTADDGAPVTVITTPAADYRISEGDQTYYYRRGEDAPYLVRHGDDYYAYRNGVFDRAVDAQGRDLPPARRDQARRDAQTWAARGRTLRRTAGTHVPTPPPARPGVPARPSPTHGNAPGHPRPGTATPTPTRPDGDRSGAHRPGTATPTPTRPRTTDTDEHRTPPSTDRDDDRTRPDRRDSPAT